MNDGGLVLHYALTLLKWGVIAAFLVVAFYYGRKWDRLLRRKHRKGPPVRDMLVLAVAGLLVVWAWSGFSSAYRPKGKINVAPTVLVVPDRPSVVEPPSKVLSGEDVQPSFREQAESDQRKALK